MNYHFTKNALLDKQYFFLPESYRVTPKISFLVLIFLCLVFLSISEKSLADGVIIPTYVGKLPEIPIQRAIIKHLDGVETLIIESTFEGMGQSFGWIIPIPAIPSKFEELTPGFMKMLSFQTQPNFVHLDQFTIGLIICSVIFLSIFVFTIIFKKWRFLKIFLIVSGIALICLVIVIPNFISYRSSGGEEGVGIKIISTQVIGDYHIAVIKANNSGELNKWLVKNGYVRVNEKALGIVTEYIDKGWCFVAAKLLRKEEGQSTTHPILMQFISEKPVYPMRLTSLSESNVQLELFVIAKEEALPVNYSLNKEYCNIFYAKTGKMNPTDSYQPDSTNNTFPFIAFIEKSGTDRGNWRDTRRIVHRDAIKVMWDGCVVTKLTGNISSNQMKKDLLFRYKELHPSYEPFRKKVWGYQTSILIAGIISYLVGLTIFIITFFIAPKSKFLKKSRPALIVFIPAIVFFPIYLGLGEKVKIEKTYCSLSRANADIKNAFTASQAYLTDYPDGLPTLENLKDCGFVGSTCVDLMIEGKGKSDLKITATLLSDGRSFVADHDGRIYKKF